MVNVKGTSIESGRNEEHAIRNSRKGDPCYRMVKNLDKLCSSVL